MSTQQDGLYRCSRFYLRVSGRETGFDEGDLQLPWQTLMNMLEHDKDLQRLLAWLREKEWENWDAQPEQDAAAGRLDFLIEEALSEKKKGYLKDL